MTEPIPEISSLCDQTRIIERPDGFYWQDVLTDALYGPFPTLLEAVQDMEYSAESDFEPGETLAEAEAEIGVTGWVDPVTGEPLDEGTANE